MVEGEYCDFCGDVMAESFAEELDELKAWKHDVGGFLGQRGIDNVMSLVKIVNAALEWHEHRHVGGETERVHEAALMRACADYESMVDSRAEESCG